MSGKRVGGGEWTCSVKNESNSEDGGGNRVSR